MKAAKALMAFLTALGTWGATAFADSGLNAVEAFGLCGVFAAAVIVYAVPNSETITVKRDDSGKFEGK